jgi:hypothetical protein
MPAVFGAPKGIRVFIMRFVNIISLFRQLRITLALWQAILSITETDEAMSVTATALVELFRLS